MLAHGYIRIIVLQECVLFTMWFAMFKLAKVVFSHSEFNLLVQKCQPGRHP